MRSLNYTFKQRIGTAIRILRQKSGLNQEQFAEKCTVAHDSLRKWETLKNVPSAENIDKICIANDIDIVDLLLLTEPQNDKSVIIREIINRLNRLAH